MTTAAKRHRQLAGLRYSATVRTKKAQMENAMLAFGGLQVVLLVVLVGLIIFYLWYRRRGV